MILTQARRPTGYIGIGWGGKDELFTKMADVTSWKSDEAHDWVQFLNWSAQIEHPVNGYDDDPE